MCSEANIERIWPLVYPGCHYEIPASPHAIFNPVPSQLDHSHSQGACACLCVCLCTSVCPWSLLGYILGGCNCLATCLRHISYMPTDYRPCQSLFSGGAVESSCQWDAVSRRSFRCGDTTTVTVLCDPSNCKHKPGLIFWASLSSRANRTPDPGAVLRK